MNEIRTTWQSGATLYAVIRQLAGYVWWPAGQVFEVWGTDGRSNINYAIALTDKLGGMFVADFDSNVPAGRYDVQIFLQADVVSPTATDTSFGSSEFKWSGSARSFGEGLVNGQGNLGDYKEDRVVYFTWDTYGREPSSVGDIRVYADNEAFEIAVPTGISDTRNFAGIGVNQCTIDLSANIQYRTLTDFSVVLVNEVIQGQSVSSVLATFSIGKRYQGQVFRKDA